MQLADNQLRIVLWSQFLPPRPSQQQKKGAPWNRDAQLGR
jgi:hypothetical protein